MNRQRGFSLLELMIAFCVASILVTIGMVTVANLRDRAMLAVFQNDISIIRQAAVRFQQDCGFFPPNVDSGVDPGLANQYGWQLGNHSPDWETLTCDNWRGPYLREWPHNPWGGLYGWSNFPGQYGPWGIPGAGAYLTLQSSDWGGANGMPDAVFEKMAEEMGLDRSPMKGVIAVWMGKDQPAGGTQPAAR